MTGLDALDLQERAGIGSIYFTPPSPTASTAHGIRPSLSVEIAGGPKRFARLWLPWRPVAYQPQTDQITAEWGWALHPTAVCVWRDPHVADLMAEHPFTHDPDPEGP